MNKSKTLLLTALMAVSLAACAQTGTTPPPGPGPDTPTVFQNFEAPVDVDAADSAAQIRTYKEKGADPLVITQETIKDADNKDTKALKVVYNLTGSWGGFDFKIADASGKKWSNADWSSFKAITFMFYGEGSGKTYRFDLLDNKGPNKDIDSAERFEFPFKDDTKGWKKIEVPFDQLVRRGWQPSGETPNDGVTLSEVWGFTLELSNGQGEDKSRTIYFDDFKLVPGGTKPPVSVKASLSGTKVAVNEGAAATFTVKLDKKPTAAVTVKYSTADKSAKAGTNYTAASGTLNFAAGEDTKTFTVQTSNTAVAEGNVTVKVTLSDPSGATLGTDKEGTVYIKDGEKFPYQDSSKTVEFRVNDLLSRMTLEEKIGQMTQAERGAVNGKKYDLADLSLGSLLSGGGSAPTTGNNPEDWANMVDDFQNYALLSRLSIPMLYGVDGVHGHHNVYGTTIFPHNIGLGATRNPVLAKQIGEVTAAEIYATGIRWDFSPCVCVGRDERWGRTYESFGEDPEIASMMTPIIDGYQGASLNNKNSVMATAKHYVGDGGTTYTGGKIDQGNTEMDEATLRKIHLPPFIEAIKRNVGSIMPSYSSFNGLKMHANKHLLTDVLKTELGFKGFLISDWAAIDQIPGDYNSDITTSINAGLDMIMVPDKYQTFYEGAIAEVKAGHIQMSRIDDAVKRILTKKFELGLFEKPFSDRSEIAQIGSAAHRAVARQAVQESLVLLKNQDSTLPLKKTGKLLVAGNHANNIGLQSGGWTISWQGSAGAITKGTTILEGIKAANAGAEYVAAPTAADVTGKGYEAAIVVVGEQPYAEGAGDNGTLTLSANDQNTINNVCSNVKCVVVLVSGRPMIINDELSKASAFVAAWLPGSEGAGVADVLFGDKDFKGKLPVSWPRSVAQLPLNVGDATYDPLFAYGFGLNYAK
ncbi:glycoside hydrolase family 3 N-terminal domain-containing protein [Deinococcus roseus]|uniref:beta-glucosidase n=1 Tax=Deinococcus roseus TaxID=392414 RepID=A0ABQ2DA56_9DEIO|nr:glycoside hydrolase family 3 N-terminal domain-containing protein [Deinococcus roseus]GGJ48734.1 hypothetical protein GCM10008938_38440 [Deinococcus roseus]